MAEKAPARRQYVCESGRLTDGGMGFCFKFKQGGSREWPAFIVRYQGQVYGYLNQCPHEGLELNWEPDKFFNRTGDALMCSAHGAIYDPKTGGCLGGPCQGRGLRPLAVEESQDKIYVKLISF